MSWTWRRAAPIAADLQLVLIIGVTAAMAGARYLEANRFRSMVEWELGPAAMMACGRGFMAPDAAPPALTAFLLREQEAVSCDLVSRAAAVAPPAVSMGERHAISLASLALRWGSLSWRTVDAYMGALFGLSMSLAWGIFRLATGRTLALAGVIMLAWSNQLPALASFRDYGKQPAFYAVWLAAGWLLWRGRAGAGRALYLPSAAAGLLVGAGLGVRVDLLVCVPAVLGVLLFGIAGWDRPALLAKTRAAAIFLAAGLAAGAPTLLSMSRGSNSAHVVVLGLLQSFDQTLGLEPAPYGIGDTYSDLFGYTVIAAHADLVQRVTVPVSYGSAEYDRVGGRLLSDLAAWFPADVMIRGLAATAQVIRYPFDGYARGSHRTVAPFNESYWFAKTGEWRDRILAFAEGRELLLALLVLLIVSIKDWRLGLTGAALVLFFCGYAMLQFSRRHTFHLDLIPIGLALLLVDGARVMAMSVAGQLRTGGLVGWPGAAGRMRAGLLAIVMVSLGTWALIAGARWWQQRHVVQLVERTLDLPWVEWVATPEPLTPSPNVTRAWPAEPAVLLRMDRPEAPPRRVQTEYLRIEVGPACGQRAIQVVPWYAGSGDFSQALRVAVDAEGESQVMAPVYYQDGPDWTRFEGVAIAAAQAACVRGVRRAADPRAVPLPVLQLALAPGWREWPWYQQLELPPRFTAAGTRSYRTHPPSINRED